MKTLAAILLLAILTGCSSTDTGGGGSIPDGSVIPNPDRQMRAVCIGWNRVNPMEWNGWTGYLPDCEFDAVFAAEMWQEAGVQATVLLSDRATISACKEALRESLDGLNPGDWLIVWVSGHGGQATDDNGDEDDGMDEYICAYDGPVTDDTIQDWLRAVPEGVCVLWVCDTCHSGTMNRQPVIFSSRLMSRGMKGQLILMSGCTEAGVSYSTGQGGAWSTALHDTGPQGMTPASWMRAARKKMNKDKQYPQYVEYGPVKDEFRFGLILPVE